MPRCLYCVVLGSSLVIASFPAQGIGQAHSEVKHPERTFEEILVLALEADAEEVDHFDIVDTVEILAGAVVPTNLQRKDQAHRQMKLGMYPCNAADAALGGDVGHVVVVDIAVDNSTVHTAADSPHRHGKQQLPASLYAAPCEPALGELLERDALAAVTVRPNSKLASQATPCLVNSDPENAPQKIYLHLMLEASTYLTVDCKGGLSLRPGHRTGSLALSKAVTAS
jgi:hypothetical protein